MPQPPTDPPPSPGSTPPPMTADDLAAEVASLRAELHRLNSHRFFRIQNSLPRLLLYQLSNGIMAGLGTVIGATLVVSVVLYFLSQIELVPIIGDYATQIIQQIRHDDPSPPPEAAPAQPAPAPP